MRPWVSELGGRPRLRSGFDRRLIGDVTEPLAPAIVDAELAAKAADLLPPEPWNHETWRAWTKAISVATGHKGKALYMPIRLALTGLEHGPELQDLLPMIGRKRAHARLMGQAA